MFKKHKDCIFYQDFKTGVFNPASGDPLSSRVRVTSSDAEELY